METVSPVEPPAELNAQPILPVVASPEQLAPAAQVSPPSITPLEVPVVEPKEPSAQTSPPLPQLRPVHRPPETRREHVQHRPPTPEKLKSLQQASQEVSDVIDQLNEVLRVMEEIQEILDDVEVQQRADEREIESLRNTIRQFHRPPQQQNQPRRPQDHHRHRHDHQRGQRSPSQRPMIQSGHAPSQQPVPPVEHHESAEMEHQDPDAPRRLE